MAWTDEELDALPALKVKADANGYTHCEIIDADEVYAPVPHLGPGALGGLTVPDESIICTWTTNLALATDAVARGVALLTATRRRRQPSAPSRTTLHTTGVTRGPAGWSMPPDWAPTTSTGFGHDRFTVTPRRGELLVFDKLARAAGRQDRAAGTRRRAARASWSARPSTAT